MIPEFDLIILVPTHHEAKSLARQLGLKLANLPAGDLSLRAFFLPAQHSHQAFNYCLIQVGIGNDYPQQIIRYLLTICKCQHFLLTGTAGGINPELSAGAVVLCNKVISLAGNTENFTRSLHLDPSFIEEHCWLVGLSVCVDEVVCHRDIKQEVFERTGGMCVEMESAGCCSILAENDAKLSFHHLRVILDDYKTSIKPEIGRLITDQGDLNWFKLAKMMLLRPAVIIELIQLGRISSKSLRLLAQGILRFVQLLKCAKFKC